MASSTESSSSVTEGAPPAVKAKPKRPQFSKMEQPCRELSMASIKCLENNQTDREKCAQHFQRYRDCRKAETERKNRVEAANNPNRQGKFFF